MTNKMQLCGTIYCPLSSDSPTTLAGSDVHMYH